MPKTRYFVAWGRYHDTPEEMIDHLHSKGQPVGQAVLYPAVEPGSLTGSVEICPPDEES